MKKIIFILTIFLTCHLAKSDKLENEVLEKMLPILIQFEGLKTNAYKDGAMNYQGKMIINYSIGIGMAFYSNKNKVLNGDVITKRQAIKEARKIILSIHKRLMKENIDYNEKVYFFYKEANIKQKLSLISLVYNLGYNGFIRTNIPLYLVLYNESFNKKLPLLFQEYFKIILRNEFWKHDKNNESILRRRHAEFLMCKRLK